MGTCAFSPRRIVRTALMIAAFLPAFAGATTAAAQTRVAVLDLRNEAGVDDSLVDYLSETNRTEAQRTFGNGYLVMQQEAIQALLPPDMDYATCTDTDCEVTFGRMVGADIIITGEIHQLAANDYRLTLKMHNTVSGALEASERRSAASIGDLVSFIEYDSGAWIARWMTDSAAASQVATNATLEVASFRGMQLEVLGNGRRIGVSDSPIPLTEGTWDLEVRAPGYVPYRTTLTLSAGQTRQLRDVRLEPLPATLAVTSNVAGASVTADGQPVGVTVVNGVATFEIPATVRSIGVARDGYVARDFDVTLQPGARRELDAQLLRGGRGVLVVQGFPAGATVEVNDVEVGRAPATGDLRATLLAGALRVVVRFGAETLTRRTVTLVEGQTLTLTP